MNKTEAFAALALAAVACDGVFGRDEARALRQQLEFRYPYQELGESAMIALFDQLLSQLRKDGVNGLISQALPALSPQQQETALAVSAQLIHSDGEVLEQEALFLNELASKIDLPSERAMMMIQSISALNRDSLLN